MLRSTDRFLTTHTGSLPRPDDLVQMMFAKEEGIPVDAAALDARVHRAIAETVGREIEAGIDIVNDGEMSKPSYATYVKDRLTGFGGSGTSYVFQDLAEFPGTTQRVFANPGRKARKTPACNGPIEVKDRTSAKRDVEDMAAAMVGRKTEGQFSSAASPGVISLFFRNDYYKSQEEYLYAIAEAMRFEYETIAEAGMILQLDCPDLAMGRHVQYADLEPRRIPRTHAAAYRGAEPRGPQHPGRAAAHAYVLGQLSGAASLRRAVRPDHRLCFDGASRARSLFEAANPRHAHEWEMFETFKPPEGKVMIPGVIECQSNLYRASRNCGAAHRPLRQTCRPRERHGGRRLRLQHPCRLRAASIPTWSSPSCGAGGRRQIASREVLEALECQRDPPDEKGTGTWHRKRSFRAVYTTPPM